LERFYNDSLADSPPPTALDDIKCGESQIYEARISRDFRHSLCTNVRIDTKVKDTDDPQKPADKRLFTDLAEEFRKEAKLECERQLKGADGSSVDLESLRRRVEKVLSGDGVTDPTTIAEILMPLRRAADSMECTPNPDKCEKLLETLYYLLSLKVDPVVYQYDIKYEHADAAAGQETYQTVIDIYFNIKIEGWIWFKISCVK